MTPTINDTRSTAVTPVTEAGQSRSRLSADLDNFLKLLTTQLQHQDPLEPLDTNQFTQQLVQFASVEQQIASNENLEKLLALQDTSQSTAALGYLGRTVDIEGKTIQLKDGSAVIRYNGREKAASTIVTIFDRTGQKIQEFTAPNGAGTQSVTWNGRGYDGRLMPAGEYSVKVNAVDNTGSLVERSTITSGTVDSVSNDGNNILLTVAGQTIGAQQVLAVRP